MTEHPIEQVQRRWQRRYGGRRFVLGVPVPTEPLGSMVEKHVTFDIEMRRAIHVLRAALYPRLRRLHRFIER